MILCFNPSLFIWAFCPPGSEKTPFVFLLIFSKLILPQDFPTTELLGHSFSGIPNWWQVPIAISTFQIIFLCPMTRTYLQLKEAIWVWSSIVFNSTAACWCHCSGNSVGCTAFKTAKLFFPTKKNSIPRFHADFNGCSEFEAKLNCTCSPCIWQADCLPRPGMVSVSG